VVVEVVAHASSLSLLPAEVPSHASQKP